MAQLYLRVTVQHGNNAGCVDRSKVVVVIVIIVVIAINVDIIGGEIRGVCVAVCILCVFVPDVAEASTLGYPPIVRSRGSSTHPRVLPERATLPGWPGGGHTQGRGTGVGLAVLNASGGP